MKIFTVSILEVCHALNGREKLYSTVELHLRGKAIGERIFYYDYSESVYNKEEMHRDLISRNTTMQMIW